MLMSLWLSFLDIAIYKLFFKKKEAVNDSILKNDSKQFILFEKKIKNDKMLKNDAIKMNAYVIILWKDKKIWFHWINQLAPT